MKLSIYLIGIVIVLSGCSKGVDIKKSSDIYGSWHTNSKKVIGSKEVDITIKEQFFKNGILLSSKWFNFKDKNSQNLGEYYITKAFRYKKEGNIIKAKFIRCSTGITKPLKSKNLGYYKLSKLCKKQPKSYKITAKRFKIINNRLYLEDKVYKRD